MQSTRRFLTIHFAPSTACITLEITEDKYNALVEAMGKHRGDVVLKTEVFNEMILTEIKFRVG